MRWLVCVVVLVAATACGGAPAVSPAARPRQGPDVVSAEWTSGDDAVLEAPPSPK